MANSPLPALDLSPAEDSNPATIVLAGGCFWCVEAVFLPVAGVAGVRSGYAGGTADTANYAAVCSGTTDWRQPSPSSLRLRRPLMIDD